MAGAAIAGATREDQTRANNSAEPAYDSPERRQQLEKSLEGHPDREAVKARLMFDKHQGTPPSAAVSSEPNLGKTSGMKSSSRGRSIEQGARER